MSSAVGIAQAPPCMTTRAGRPLKETDCISCGQCTVFCPTGAIREVDHTSRVMRALLDPDKVVVLQTAPSVRVTIAEMFGGQPGECSEGRLVGAAKMCGFQFVFDTNMTADLTIMEEANELLKRIDVATNGTDEEKKQMPLPMFTSCCPGWINLVEQSYPELIPHLSTCRSPMGMLSSIIRHHWWHRQQNILNQHGSTKENNTKVDQSKLFVVAVMPCTAKKDEMTREQFRMPNGQPETDAVLTVREFARLVELRGVAQRNDYNSFKNIVEMVYDNPFGESSGAAVIFGVTGGVMEAALRTAADVLSGKSFENVAYNAVRGLYGIKEAIVKLGKKEEIPLSVAVCHQMRNVREFLAQIEQGEKVYHFIEIMTCPGGCIGGGGLPQSRDADVLTKRINGTYSMDERMVKRKSHENEAVKSLYENFLGEPLSHRSHKLLHTHYFSRPRKPPVTLKMPASSAAADFGSGDSSNTIYVVFGTQSGTAAQAAKEVKIELQQFITRRKVSPEPKVCLVAADAMSPANLMELLTNSLAFLFVTSTYGEGEFPAPMEKLWAYLENADETGPTFSEDLKIRYAVFGLGSSMYAVGDQFNRAARVLDKKLCELGAERLIEVGLGDDQAPELYRGELDKWLETLQPKLFGNEDGGGGASFLDPPEPLFRLSIAPGTHAKFRPLPSEYHFVKLESSESLVSEGYDRPAAKFTFDLSNTGLSYKVGDHLAILPRNPKTVVKQVLSMYDPEISGSRLLSVEAVDPLAKSPFPPVLTAKELLTQYLDLCARPSRSFLKQLFLFATTAETRNELRSLFEKENPNATQEEFELFTATHSYADVLFKFRKTALPPFEYILSMIPVICPRLYSIASSPRHEENKLDLLVVLNRWKDNANHTRVGLSTQFLFGAKVGQKVPVQIRTGILQLPKDPEAPLVMFGLGTGIAPFRGFLQERQKLLEEGVKLGPATLYVGFRHEKNDFYLKEDYEIWKKLGVLTNVHPAFSHDGILERHGKLYFIPDLIHDKPMDMTEALQVTSDVYRGKGVHVFYCGPAMGISESIIAAATEAVGSKRGGGLIEEDASAFMERLVHVEDRFHAECF